MKIWQNKKLQIIGMAKEINLNLVHMPCYFYRLKEIANCLIRDSIIHRSLASFLPSSTTTKNVLLALLVGGWLVFKAYKHRKIIISHLFLLFHHFLFLLYFQLHSEYKSTYRWHEFSSAAGPEVVRKPPMPNQFGEDFNMNYFLTCIKAQNKNKPLNDNVDEDCTFVMKKNQFVI